MKIGITGSHSTGKTTLLDNINYPVKIQEIARTIIGEYGMNPQDMDDRQRCLFQKDCMYRQVSRELLNSDNNIISDRTIFDVLAYSNDLPIHNELEEFVEKYIEKFPYDIVFYVPIEFAMESDGVRVEDEEYRKGIDKKILEILEKYKIPYQILKGTLEERISILNQFL